MTEGALDTQEDGVPSGNGIQIDTIALTVEIGAQNGMVIVKHTNHLADRSMVKMTEEVGHLHKITKGTNPHQGKGFVNPGTRKVSV